MEAYVSVLLARGPTGRWFLRFEDLAVEKEYLHAMNAIRNRMNIRVGFAWISCSCLFSAFMRMQKGYSSPVHEHPLGQIT